MEKTDFDTVVASQNKEILDVDKKSFIASILVEKTDYDSKIPELENKIAHCSNAIKRNELISQRIKICILDVRNFLKMANIDNKAQT